MRIIDKSQNYAMEQSNRMMVMLRIVRCLLLNIESFDRDHSLVITTDIHIFVEVIFDVQESKC